jgi:aminoglycoside phosphotransferase family enzyme
MTHQPLPSAGEPTLADKVAALGDRALYPNRPTAVECIETHMSWVFLTDVYVYKLKKPVRYEYLDFSTPALRRRNCEEEVRLNQRLAPDVYLGMIPLTQRPDGGVELDGPGPVIDWLVKMRRLSRAAMLDAAIAANTLTCEAIDRVAALLSEFYLTAPHVDMPPEVYRARFDQEIGLNRRELPAYGLTGTEFEAAIACQCRFLDDQRHLLERRAREGRIVEGHGDLRPEHIHIGPPATVIDCLEFNRELRLVDPVDELGYLAVECDRLGAPGVGPRIFAAYAARTGDQAPVALRHFYMSFRACVRARLAIWHLRDDDVADPRKWAERARDYLRQAMRHAEAMSRAPIA